MTTAPPDGAAPALPASGAASAGPVRLLRFDRAERGLHWANAALFGILMATAAVLYIGQLSALVGRREVVRQIHVWSGLLLPVPLLAALAGPWRRSVAADLAAFNRFDDEDRRWLRLALPRLRPGPTRPPRGDVRLHKFNPGQKLNAAFVGGAIVVMLATGSIMYWFGLFPLNWRTGATFVHDWTALAVGLVTIGHVRMATADPDALRSMVRGWVPAAWARHHRPRWYEAVTGQPAAPTPVATGGGGKPAAGPPSGQLVGGGGGEADGRSTGPALNG
ncbi:MAG: cytochrome b/b6 domain-containing protein [Acidimicrobiales bacterium]